MDDRFSPSQNSNGSIRGRDRLRPFNHRPVTSPTPLFTTPVMFNFSIIDYYHEIEIRVFYFVISYYYVLSSYKISTFYI